jgi:hypothetical protein
MRVKRAPWQLLFALLTPPRADSGGPATDVEAAAAAVTNAKDCLLATAAAATEIEARRC